MTKQNHDCCSNSCTYTGRFYQINVNNSLDLYKADHTQHMYVLIQSYFDRMDWSTLCNHFQKYKIIFSIILLLQLNKSIHEKKLNTRVAPSF